MKRTRSLGSLFLLIFTATIAFEGLLLESCEAQRPGQLSSKRGKRWFNKSKPESKAEQGAQAQERKGLLSDGVERRKARRMAKRQEAIDKARNAAASEQATKTGKKAATASGAAPKKAGSVATNANASTAPDAKSRPRATMMRRTTGRRGGGSGPTKRRRSILTPLFGN